MLHSFLSPKRQRLSRRDTTDPAGLEIVIRSKSERDRKIVKDIIAKIKAKNDEVRAKVEEIEDSNKRLVLEIVRGEAIKVAVYESDIEKKKADYRIDLADVEKFRGITAVPPEAVIWHEIVEKWLGMTFKPRPSYEEAHRIAKEWEAKYSGWTRIKDATSFASSTWLWTYRGPNGELHEITGYTTRDGNIYAVNEVPVED